MGVTDAAKKQGIDADKLPIEEYVLRTVGPDLYIVGKELRPEQYHGTRPLYSEPWNPLAMECVHSGTLLGVYEILETRSGRPLALARRVGDAMCRGAARSSFRRWIGPSNRGWSIATWAVGTCRRFS